MGFAGFITSGVTPAVAGALRGRNLSAQQAEEQRRYEARQAQQASGVKWERQQAIEAAQRQAMLDALAQQAQSALIKSRAEGNAIDMYKAQHPTPPSESYQTFKGPKGPGVYGVTEGREPRFLGEPVDRASGGAGGDGAGGTPKTLPGSVAQKFFENRSALATIAAAQQQVKAHPDAFGLLNVIPGRDYVDSRENVAARAPVGNIGSLVIHDRSGAAVTISEFPRLRPFIPQTKDMPEMVQEKLAELDRQIRAITEDMSLYYTDQGYGVPGETPSAAPGPRRSAMPPAASPRDRGERVDARTRAAELKAEGMTREAALQRLREEGYTVQ